MTADGSRDWAEDDELLIELFRPALQSEVDCEITRIGLADLLAELGGHPDLISLAVPAAPDAPPMVGQEIFRRWCVDMRLGGGYGFAPEGRGAHRALDDEAVA